MGPKSAPPREPSAAERIAAAPRVLLVTDRCDRCGAQAYVRLPVGGSALLFCGHHAHEHEVAAASVGGFDVDERHLLTVVPA